MPVFECKVFGTSIALDSADESEGRGRRKQSPRPARSAARDASAALSVSLPHSLTAFVPPENPRHREVAGIFGRDERFKEWYIVAQGMLRARSGFSGRAPWLITTHS